MDRLTARRGVPRWWFHNLDVAIVVVLALANLVLNWGVGPLAAGGLLLLPVPLLWRRTHPLPSAVATAVALSTMVVAGPDEAGHPLVFIATSLIATYSIAAYEPRLRHAAVGGAMVTVGWTFDLIVFGVAASDDEVWPFRIVEAAMAWSVGRASHRRRREVADLDLQTRELRDEQERRAATAVAEERTRLARELHDVVAHNVSLIVLQAGAAEQVLSDAPDQAREALQNVQRIGRQTVDELRRLLGILREHDDALEIAPQPTLARLDSLAAEIEATGVTVTVERRGGTRPLPTSVDLSAYRILQEGLTNVVRHADAANVHVLLDDRGDSLFVEIRDDGRGIGTRSGGGLGLVGVRERVALLGGTYQAGADPRGGFRLRVSLPLEASPS